MIDWLLKVLLGRKHDWKFRRHNRWNNTNTFACDNCMERRDVLIKNELPARKCKQSCGANAPTP